MPEGTYTVELSQPGCVTRKVTVEVDASTTAIPPVQLVQPGNLNGMPDMIGNETDVTDMQCLFDYLAEGEKTGALADDEAYFLAVADVNGDDTVDILDPYPPDQQRQVKIQLAQSLKGIICQQLVPDTAGVRIPVFEILRATNAVQNMIREDKLHQLESVMQSGAEEGMCSMDGSLLKLVREGRITPETAMLFCAKSDSMARRLNER